MKAVQLSQTMLADIDAMQPQVLELIRTLCAIPAPSHHEERRAAFIRDWFEARGMHAEIDEAKNVRMLMKSGNDENMAVVMAHTDTVFPDLEPMPLREENGRMYCPGVGDDTTNLAVLMLLADYLHRHGFAPKHDVLFVGNSCEEGLGNLKGCKAIMHDFAPRVKEFLSLDGDSTRVCSRAVGSSRYRITARTKGGHSFADFGNRNAIEVLSRIVTALYAQRVPKEGDSFTTYNVGMISGGTSINSIAQQAEMLYEYRSNSGACLAAMGGQMNDILKSAVPEDAQVEVELLGTRPCAGDVDKRRQKEVELACCDALYAYVGRVPTLSIGSTDCNIPLSLGIPSASFGVYRGEGEHTREEWMEPASIPAGMKAAASILLGWFEEQK